MCERVRPEARAALVHAESVLRPRRRHAGAGQVARREGALREVEVEVNARGWGGRIYALPCDCSDGHAVEGLVEAVRTISGGRDAVPDVVVLCA